MKNYKTLIFAIAIICLVSGSYAVYLGNHDTSDAPTVQRSIIDNNGVENNTESHGVDNIPAEQATQNEEDNSEPSEPVLNDFNPKSGIEYKKIHDMYVEVYDYTDLYDLRPCGGFVALGNVTKQLPERMICKDGCDAVGYHTKEMVLARAYTYEEAYAYCLGLELQNNQTEEIDTPTTNQNTNTPTTNQNTNTPTTEQTEDYSQYTFFNPSLHIC